MILVKKLSLSLFLSFSLSPPSLLNYFLHFQKRWKKIKKTKKYVYHELNPTGYNARSILLHSRVSPTSSRFSTSSCFFAKLSNIPFKRNEFLPLNPFQENSRASAALLKIHNPAVAQFRAISPPCCFEGCNQERNILYLIELF